MTITATTQQAVLAWSTVLHLEVDRLQDSRRAVVTFDRARRGRDTFTPADSLPFYDLDGHAHFTMTAAIQLVRALEAFDGDLRLPSGLDVDRLRALRNALEHWDDTTGRAQKAMAELGASATAHRWERGGAGVLGDIVSDELLAHWARGVYNEIVGIDPS
jgi:hypothetical protein